MSIKLKVEFSRVEHNQLSYLGESSGRKNLLLEILEQHASVKELESLTNEDVMLSLEVDVPLELITQLGQVAEKKAMDLNDYVRAVVKSYVELQIEVNASREKERAERTRIAKGVQLRSVINDALFEKFEEVYGKTSAHNATATEANTKNFKEALEVGLDALIAKK